MIGFLIKALFAIGIALLIGSAFSTVITLMLMGAGIIEFTGPPIWVMMMLGASLLFLLASLCCVLLEELSS